MFPIAVYEVFQEYVQRFEWNKDEMGKGTN